MKRTDHLIIKLEQSGDGKVKASIAGVSDEMDNLDESTSKASKAADTLKGVLGAVGFALVAKGLFEANREYQKLKASLTTVTGSQRQANKEWKQLESFTQSTPFQINEVVDAFIKLKALGLDPSIEALESYGNTASAMGKDLNQFIEAVADASTGEFERLKEFGIKAGQEGDKVSFTFQGITTTVRKSASDIEGYLRQIGNNTFGGAMAVQMDTLGGAASNFEDAVFKMATSFGDSGFNDLMQGTINLATDFVNILGKIPELGDSIGKAISDLVEEAPLTLEIAQTRSRINEINKELGITEENSLITTREKLQLEQRLNELLERRSAIDGDNVTYTEGGVGSDESPSSPAGDSPLDNELIKYREHLQARYVELQQSILSEQQLLQMKHEQDLIDLENYAAEYNVSIEEENLLREELEAAHQQRLTDLAEDEANRRAENEKRANDLIMQSRMQVYQSGVGLLQAFAGQSKTAAAASILISKGLQIAQIFMSTETAAAQAKTAMIVPGDPSSVARAEAAAQQIRTAGKISMGLVAATGLKQAADAYNGGASSGSPANPVNVTGNNQFDRPDAGERVGSTYTIILQGPADREYVRETIEPILKDDINNRDFVLIEQGSRQAQDLAAA